MQFLIITSIKVLLSYNFTILIGTYVINYDTRIGMLKVSLDKYLYIKKKYNYFGIFMWI